MSFPLKLYFACVLLAASPACGSDLAAQSQIGAIFDERSGHATQVLPVEETRRQGVIYIHAFKVPGYYGRPTDFECRNYYGTSPVTIFSRLPYACGFVGLC